MEGKSEELRKLSNKTLIIGLVSENECYKTQYTNNVGYTGYRIFLDKHTKNTPLFINQQVMHAFL
jgi:hypothetical protein